MTEIEYVQQFEQEFDKSLKSFSVTPNFNDCIKELMWDNSLYNVDVCDTASISVNDQEIISKRDGDYFRLIQPYQHYSNMAEGNQYSFSFALNPLSYQPSGSINLNHRCMSVNLTMCDYEYNDLRLKMYGVTVTNEEAFYQVINKQKLVNMRLHLSKLMKMYSKYVRIKIIKQMDFSQMFHESSE